MIPDYQTLMRPVLKCSESGEVRIGHVVETLADEFELTQDEKDELVAKCDHLKTLKHSSFLPHVFTQYGTEQAERKKIGYRP